MGGLVATTLSGCTETGAECAHQAHKLPVACMNQSWDKVTIAEWQLIRAASEGDVKEIHDALVAGAEVETRGDGLLRPKSNCTGVTGAPDGCVNEEDQQLQGLTPLMRAAKEGHLNAVALLLHFRASVNARDEDGMEPLHFAASAGSPEVCTALVAARADPTVTDEYGRDAFSLLPTDCVESHVGLQQWQALLQSRCEPMTAVADIFGLRIQAPRS